jgi:transcriptional regulator with XRE-family HTH domain
MTSVKTVADIGRAIRQARQALGLTQHQLAAACGVGNRYLGELERGKVTISLGPALRVVQGLGGEIVIKGMPEKEDTPGGVPSCTRASDTQQETTQ